MFLFAVSKMLDQGQYIRRRSDLKPFGANPTAGEFKGGENGGGFGRADAFSA